MNKYIRIWIMIIILLVFPVLSISLAFSANEQNQLQEEKNSQQIIQLEQEISNLKSSFYDKTMQNVNLALQGANRATTLVSVFAITFTVLTLILGFWGMKELSSIRKVRLDAEKNLKLTKHFNLAYAYVQASLFQDSLREFLKVVEIDKENDIAHTQLGYLFMSLPQPESEQSKFHSKRAIEINPKNYTAYLNLGVVMNQKREKQEDILEVYLKGEKIAIEQKADDITTGKLKMFAGHCYKNLNNKAEAKIKYDEARPYFEKYKNSQIKELADIVKIWLDELEKSYKSVVTV